MGDSNLLVQTKGKENTKKSNGNNSKKKKKKRGGSKRKLSVDQLLAYKSVGEWVFLGQSNPPSASSNPSFDDDFRVHFHPNSSEKLVFDLHSHSICSDGFLSPSKLVERAHQNGVSLSIPPLLPFLVFTAFLYVYMCIMIGLLCFV